MAVKKQKFYNLTDTFQKLISCCKMFAFLKANNFHDVIRKVKLWPTSYLVIFLTDGAPCLFRHAF